MKWVKVQLPTFLSTALPSHAFALRHLWNQECTQNMMFIFLSTVQFVSWTPLKVDAFKVRQKLGHQHRVGPNFTQLPSEFTESLPPGTEESFCSCMKVQHTGGWTKFVSFTHD